MIPELSNITTSKPVAVENHNVDLNNIIEDLKEIAEANEEGTTSAPTTTEIDNSEAAVPFEEILPNFTMEALHWPDSPQSFALGWLRQHPQFDAFPNGRNLQLFALATFFFF